MPAEEFGAGGKTMSDCVRDNPALMAEWNWEKNDALRLFPDKLTTGSNKKAWWKCAKGHEWEDPIYKRADGKKCPYCENKRVLIGYNDLQTLFPLLAKEWDFEKNTQVDMLAVVPGSAKRVWWKCSVCGYSWETSVRARTQRSTGCPQCMKKKRAETRQKTILEKNGSIADPVLLKEWHYEKNGEAKPSQFTSYSNQSVWWRCSTCGYEWKARISNRAKLGRGCPCCVNHVVVKGKNDLATVRPALAQEWHPTKNGDLTPEQVTIGCGKKVWWLCPKGHTYQASVMHRGHGTNCPICNEGRQTSFAEQALFYYVRQVYPDAISRCKDILPGRMELDIYIPSAQLAIEYDGVYWHKGKRDREEEKYDLCREKGIRLIRIREEELSDTSRKTADILYHMDNLDTQQGLEKMLKHLLDQLDPHSNFRTRKDPRCVHSPVDVNVRRDEFKIREYMAECKEDSLADLRPDLAAEWHPTKNEGLTPYRVTLGSSIRVWWRCRVCGHEWQTTVGHRVSGTGCPVCYRQRNKECHPLAKKIYQYTVTGEFVREWKSISEAARTLSINSSNITMCAKRKRNQAGGFCWKYDPPPEEK